MGTIWRIRAGIQNQGYNLPEWVGKTTYKWNYTRDQDSYLPYRGWSIDSHKKLSKS